MSRSAIIREILRAVGWIGAFIACTCGLVVACEGTPVDKPAVTHVVDPFAPMTVALKLTPGDRYAIAQTFRTNAGGSELAGTVTVTAATPYWTELEVAGLVNRQLAATYTARLDVTGPAVAARVTAAPAGDGPDAMHADVVGALLQMCAPPRGAHVRGNLWNVGDASWRLTSADAAAATVTYAMALDRAPSSPEGGGEHDTVELTLHVDDGLAGTCHVHRSSSIMGEGISDDYTQTITRLGATGSPIATPAPNAIAVARAFHVGDHYRVHVEDGGAVLDGVASVDGLTSTNVAMLRLGAMTLTVHGKAYAGVSFNVTIDLAAKPGEGVTLAQTSGPQLPALYFAEAFGSECVPPAEPRAIGESWNIGTAKWTLVDVAPVAAALNRKFATFKMRRELPDQTDDETLTLALDDGLSGTCTHEHTDVIMHEGHTSGWTRTLTKLPPPAR